MEASVRVRQPKPPRPAAPTKRVVAAAVILLALGAAGAIQAGIAGGSFMYDLELVEPPLARTLPVIDPGPAPRLARRVFVVIIDGLRFDKSYELPFLDELRRRGVDGEASSHYPTWSRPNYVSILTGVPPNASGVRTNYHTTPVQLDSLMDRARAANLRVATATDYSPLPRLFLRHRAPVAEAPALEELAEFVDDVEEPVGAGVAKPDADLASPFDDARYAPWPGGFREAGIALVHSSADLVIMLIGAVDAAGHAHGAASPEYRQAAEAADHALAHVLARIDLELDAVIVTADHGHTNGGGHGGLEPEVVSVPLIAAGAGIVPDAVARDARLIDVAPTVSALLGIPAPGHGLGRTLLEVLALDAGARAQRDAADRARVTATEGTVAAAEARAAVDVLEHRAARVALVAAGAGLAILLACVLIRQRVLRLDLRVLVVTIPAFFIVYVGLIGTVGQFSPSIVPARGHIAEVLLQYGIAGMVVQLLASTWTLRGQQRLAERLAAANGIAWTGLMLTMVPAGLVWAFFPTPYVTVPAPLWLVVIPALEVAVACAAINVALTLLVELIVFLSRAWHRGVDASAPEPPPPPVACRAPRRRLRARSRPRASDHMP